MKVSKKLRKILSMFLVAVMLISCMSGFTVASAAETTETAKTNLALNKPVEVSGLEVEGLLLGEMAVDGDAATRWSSSPNEEQQWMIVDMEEVQKMNEVSILFRECPQYQVLVSADGENYEVVGEVTNGSHGLEDLTKVFTFDTVEARYVKFLQLESRTVSGQTYGVTIWELEVYYNEENESEEGGEGNEGGIDDGSQDEIDYYDVNLALNKATEVSGCEVDWLPGEYAVDGTRDTRWSADPNEEQQWIIVDLGDVYKINEVFLYYQEPPKMLVQVSVDGENFTTVYEMTDGIVSGDSVERIISFDTVDARYVKLLQLERRNTHVGVYSMGVWEMEVYCREVIDYEGQNLALSKTVEYSGAEVDWLPGEYAVDGDRETRWSASPDSDDQWIIVDLGKVYSINEVYMYGMEAPKYQIFVSTDGENYSLVMDITDGVSSLDSIERTFRFDTVKARYVKLQQLERRNTPYGLYSNVLWELEVYYKTSNTYDSIDDIQQIPPTISEDGTKLILPEVVKEGYEVRLYGSSNEAVVAMDGTVIAPLEDKTLTVMYQLVNINDTSDAEIAEKEVEITIPGKYQKEESDNAKPAVLPAIQEWKGHEGSFSLKENSKLVLGDASLYETAEMINYYFAEMLGKTLEITEGTPDAGDIYLTLGNKAELGEEGYEIEIADVVTVEAYEAKGVLYAGTTITQILFQDDDCVQMPKGLIRDYPAYEVRSAMFDVARFYMPIDYLEEITKYMAYYKCNEIHVHINDDGGEQTSCFRIESKLYPEINSGNADGKVYTQEEYKNYQKEAAKFGIKVVTELDSPSHTGYVGYHDSSMMLDVNHMDIRNEEAVAFIKNVLDELLDGEDPVIQTDTFHVGCDEYFRYDAERFVEYREEVPYYEKEISDYVMSKGYNCRMWNMLGSEVYPGVGIVSTDVEMNYFYPSQANYKETWEAGYAAINSYADYLYIVPEVGYANNRSLSSLYEIWDVNNFGGGFVVPKSSPLLLGAEPCFWYDIKVGTSEFDVFHAMKKEIMLVAEKAWYGEMTTDQSTAEFLERVETLGVYAPGANPARFVKNADEIVADYDFETVEASVVKDASANQYDAVMTGLELAQSDGNYYVKLDGEGYVTLPFDSLGYPYTIDFDLYIDENTPENAVLFDGNDGTLFLNYDGTGKMGYERKGYSYIFDYAIEYGKWTHFTISGDTARTRLYVDYTLIGSGTYYNVTASREASSTFVLPVEKVGAGVVGYMDNVVLYDKVIVIKDPNNKNLALNKPVQVSGCEVDWLPGEYAVDGDDTTRWSCSPDYEEQWIVVDLGEVYTIDKVHFYFLEAPRYQILVSTDGENYELAVDVTDGVSSLDSITRTFTFAPVEARYVKVLQLERRNTAYGLYGMVIWEMEVYEKEPEVFQIVKQPESVSAVKGEVAEVSVEATGKGLTYKWYYKNPGNKKFYESGADFVSEDGTVYTIPMYAWRDGQEVYCVVTDENGETIQSNTVTLTMDNGSIKIIKQPEDVVVEVLDDTAAVTVEATGEGLSYQWYYKNPGNVKFYVSGSDFVSEDGAAYTIAVARWRDGQEVYCVITDANGVSVQTNTVTLSVQK